tara:strand:+ start:547 stop:1377 length:831 start_codon:yes stop_codon:yes gene_type:complete
MKIDTVGIVGLGKMGSPIAQHLAKTSLNVFGFDVMPNAVNKFQNTRVKLTSNCAELAAKCDLVIVSVGFDSEVEEVIFGATGALVGVKQNTVLAIASTISPQRMKEIEVQADTSLVKFLDIPLCRGEQAAADGDLLILGGGEKKIFDACTPVFKNFSSDLYYLGELGAGQVGKMVNNLILWTCISANTEGLLLAKALGVKEEVLRDALLSSSAHNWAMEVQADKWEMPWAEKDMSIVLEEADSARISLPLCGTVKEVIKGIKIGLGQGMPNKNTIF